MTHHEEAWNHVKEHLFGTVCEVTRKKPWGFKQDRDDIVNVTVQEFLESTDRYDTIILHILSGEGVDAGVICVVIEQAIERCIKLVILEHNPNSKDFKYLHGTQYMYNLIRNKGVVSEHWGRNFLLACTTFRYLQLPQLSDAYYKKHINNAYVSRIDHGIDPSLKVYTHTSEQPVSFDLPEGTIYWVIGGGIVTENMETENENILIDSVLKQVLLCANDYEPGWKVDRLFDFSGLRLPDWKNEWRVIEPNGVTPDKILHLSLEDLDCEDCTVYVSTVHIDQWWHLIKKNRIMEAWTSRNKIILRK